MAVLRRFLVIFSTTTLYLSQNWSSDGHFEVLNRSKLRPLKYLNDLSLNHQKLWHKTQMRWLLRDGDRSLFDIYYPIFEDHFFDFKKVVSEKKILMDGLYSRAVCNTIYTYNSWTSLIFTSFLENLTAHQWQNELFLWQFLSPNLQFENIICENGWKTTRCMILTFAKF